MAEMPCRVTLSRLAPELLGAYMGYLKPHKIEKDSAESGSPYLHVVHAAHVDAAQQLATPVLRTEKNRENNTQAY